MTWSSNVALQEPVEREARPDRAAPHLFPVERGWALWRSVCLRGAGFPAREVADLAAPACARAVDRLLALEDACEAARAEALRACEEGNRLGAEKAGSALSRAMKRLRAGQAPEPFDATEVVAGAVERFARARQAAEAARAAARDALAEATPAVGARLRAAASDAEFRKAMLWQNRAAVKGTVDALLRRPAGAVDKKTREHERLMASYVQRYCAKNDTIGFFGPVGWGTIADDAEALSLCPGPALLSRRTVYFESWGMQLLAATLSSDPELRRHVAPRRMPTVRLEGETLFHSVGRSTELPVEYARIVELCDGERTAAEIAAALCADASLPLCGEEEVYALLEQLAEKRVVTWGYELPTALAHPERALRDLVARAPACQARERALASLGELERLRDAVAAARDDEAALDRSIAELEAGFERVTGASARRRAGEAYAGRTLIYEDCVRDADLRLGPALVERLAPPLALVLQAARWYTHQIGRRYQAALARVHARLREETGAEAIEFVRFLTQAQELFSGSQHHPSPIVRDVIDELRARWAAALRLPAEARRVERTVASLRLRVDALFDAPHPGWPGARYHSPDLMIAAASVEAVRRGEFLLVLGELHPGDNTASNPVFVHQHPDPAELVRAVEHDLPTPRVAPVVPKERSTRADQLSLARHDLEVEFGTTRSSRPRGQVLAVADLVVEEVDGALYARTRDGRRRFHVLEFFEHYLKLESIAHFTLLPLAAHSPRVTIDGLVVARERWRFEPADLAFAAAAEPLDRLVGARRWAARHGLPRTVFVKIPEEVKPCFVDLESPVYVEILAKLARRASSLVVSEMLPSLDDAWLVDGEGRAFTSELRLVAVDPERWRP